MNRLIIAGSRTITDRKFIQGAMNQAWKDLGPFQVIAGGARGVDSVAASLANDAGITTTILNADWDKWGKSAGYRRNEAMARVATHLLVVWDGESKGAGHMIDIAEKAGLPVRVVIYKKEGAA